MFATMKEKGPAPVTGADPSMLSCVVATRVICMAVCEPYTSSRGGVQRSLSAEYSVNGMGVNTRTSKQAASNRSSNCSRMLFSNLSICLCSQEKSNRS